MSGLLNLFIYTLVYKKLRYRAQASEHEAQTPTSGHIKSASRAYPDKMD